MITTDTIMATEPCERYPRSVVAAHLAKYGPFVSWTQLANVASLAGWPVPPGDILLTTYRALDHGQRLVIAQWATRKSLDIQEDHWPAVTARLANLRQRLRAWSGAKGEAKQICRDAYTYLCSRSMPGGECSAAYQVHSAAFWAEPSPIRCVSSTEAVSAVAELGACFGASTRVKWEALLYICELLDQRKETRT